MFFGCENLCIDFVEAFGFTQTDCVSNVRARRVCALSFRFEAEDTAFRFGKKELTAEKGDIIFVPSGVDYVRVSKRDEVAVAHFTAAGTEFGEIERFRPENPQKFRRLFEKLLDRHASGRGAFYAATAVLYEIICELTKEADKIKGLGFKRIEKAYNLAVGAYSRPELTVSALAAECGLSEVAFRKAFKSETGLSPHAFINSLRMRYAAQLMTAGGFTVEQIAEKSGFCDAKYFSTAFKRFFGQTPSGYRRPYIDKIEGQWRLQVK